MRQDNIQSRTYDGQINYPETRPIEFWQIDYNGTLRWIPAHYAYSVCPHCGDTAPSQWELGFGYRPDRITYLRGGGTMTPQLADDIEKSRLMGISNSRAICQFCGLQRINWCGRR